MKKNDSQVFVLQLECAMYGFRMSQREYFFSSLTEQMKFYSGSLTEKSKYMAIIQMSAVVSFQNFVYINTDCMKNV